MSLAEGPLLLDTTAFSALFRGAERDLPYQKVTADRDLLVSFITVGEVLKGAIKRGWGEQRLAELEVRIAAVGVSIQVTRRYVELLDDDLRAVHRLASPADRLGE